MEDENLLEFAEALKLTSITNSNSNVLQFQPYLRYFNGKTKRSFQEFNRIHHKVLELIDREIAEHETRHVAGNVNDFIDAYLDEIQKQQKNVKKSQYYQSK